MVCNSTRMNNSSMTHEQKNLEKLRAASKAADAAYIDALAILDQAMADADDASTAYNQAKREAEGRT